MSDHTPDALAKIREAEKSLSTREEVQNNFAMVMQPYGNIEDLISPAPLSIALLGQLILVSLETDLSLIGKGDSPPKYLTHPNSLRASLLQVCHSGWDAFNLAHKNMDAIRLKTANVPIHINDSVKIIVAGSTEEMEVILPKALKNIKRIAADCTKKAQDVERKFVDVMQVISELLKLCTAKRGDHEREIKENKAALQAAELSKVQMEKEQAEAEANLKEMKDYLRQSREDYNKALDEMPSAMGILGMSILERAANTMIDAVQMVSNPMRRVAGAAVDAVDPRARKRSKKEGKHADQFDVDDPDAPVKLSETDTRKLTWSLQGLKSVMGTLLMYLNDGKGKATGDKGAQVNFLKAQTRQLLERKKKNGDSALSHSVSSGIEQTMALIEDVVKFETSMSNNPDDFQKMQKKAEDLDGAIKMMSFQLDTQSASMPTTATPLRPGPNVTSQSSVDAAVSQSRMKCEQTSLVMRQSMENYNTANKRTQDANKEMAALVAKISQYELKELDFETIRNTLIQGIDVMGKVKEQWSKLVQYFQMMSNIVECSLQESLHGFLESAESSQELRMKKGGQYNLSKVMRDVIYLQASKANQIAHLVQGLSGTYVEVSDRHILRPLSGLDKLMALDADKDKTRIKEIQRELQQGAEDAAEAIKELVQERHDEIMEKGYERINKYEKTMREALPPPTPAEVKEIEELKEAAAKPLSEPSVDIGGW